MGEFHAGTGYGDGAMRCETGNATTKGIADWLYLAAAPTFAIMALLTGAGGGAPDVLCSAAQTASPLSGMVPMYLLMSAFHSAPWLKMISGRRGGTHRSSSSLRRPRRNDITLDSWEYRHRID
jgi:hypothetical protein